MNCCVVKTTVVALCLLALAASAQSQIVLEPKSAALSGPFVLTNNCICQAIDAELTNGGRATFTFSITNPGDYVVRARVERDTSRAGSFYVNMDAEPGGPEMIWEIPAEPAAVEQLVNWKSSGSTGIVPLRKVFRLSAGEHRLVFVGRSAETRLARVSVLRLPDPPGGLHVAGQTPPAPSARPPAPPRGLRIVTENP